MSMLHGGRQGIDRSKTFAACAGPRPRARARRRGRERLHQGARAGRRRDDIQRTSEGRHVQLLHRRARRTSTRTTPRSPRARRSVQALFDSLTAFDPLDPSKLLPAAAEKWAANADATVWTFNLNKDAKFSRRHARHGAGLHVRLEPHRQPEERQHRHEEGRRVGPVVPPALGQGLRRRRRPAQATEHVRPQGHRRLHARGHAEASRSPTSSTSSAHPALAPVPQGIVEGGVDYNGTKVAFGDMPIGNGPFKMAEPWKHDQYIKVVRNDDYYGDEADHRRHRLQDLQGPGHRLPRVPGRQPRLHPDRRPARSRTRSRQVRRVAPDGYTVEPGQAGPPRRRARHLLPGRQQQGPDARRTRTSARRISLAINRQAICDTVFEGTRDPADNIVPPGIAGYETGVWPDAKYDVEAAKKALADAGYPGGQGCSRDHAAVQHRRRSREDHGARPGGPQGHRHQGQARRHAGLPDVPEGAGRRQVPDRPPRLDRRLPDHGQLPVSRSSTRSRPTTTRSTTTRQSTRRIEDARKITDTARAPEGVPGDRQDRSATTLPVIPLMFYKHHHVGVRPRPRLHVLRRWTSRDFTRSGSRAAADGSTETTQVASRCTLVHGGGRTPDASCHPS